MADVVTVWNPFIITNNGLNLRQEAIATGKTVTFNYAEIGQGVPASPAAVPLLNGLVSPARQVPVVRSESNGATHFVGVRVDNADFAQPVLMRELGLFAALEGGEPVLYGYTFAAQGYDSIPAGSVSHYIWTIGIDTVLSRAQSVSFTYDGSTVYASYDDIDRLIRAFDDFKAEVTALGGGVVFSPTHPSGGWSLWLQDLGEADLPAADDGVLTLNTAPTGAPGEFTVTDASGAAETVTNMTSDPQTAGPGDIVVTDQTGVTP
jgi:hypothetical protein